MTDTQGRSADASTRPSLLVGLSVLASVLLVGGYLAAGGSSYEPTAIQNPCDPREWRDPGSLEEITEQFSLSAIDGAACELGVSREELAPALATVDARADFAEKYGIDDETLEAAVQAGLVRAVDDAQEAGALSPLIAAPLREIAKRVPVDEGIALIEDSGRFFDATGGFLEGLPELLDQASGLLPDELEGLAP